MEMTMKREALQVRLLAVGVCAVGLLATAAYLVVGTVNKDLGVVAAAVAAVVLVAGTRLESAGRRFYRGGIAFVGVVGASFPVFINVFVHIDDERYGWVIAQPGICAHLGSGAVLVLSIAFGACFGFGALGMLIATRRVAESIVTWSAVGLAAIVSAAVGALVIVSPHAIAAVFCA